MDINQVIAAFVAICAAVLVGLGAAKFSALRAALLALLTESPHALRDSLDSLAAVVKAQGESIAFLRTELDATRAELEVARLAVKENSALRERVQELEEQVRQLESELTRRRKYTRKDYLTRAEGGQTNG